MNKAQIEQRHLRSHGLPVAKNFKEMVGLYDAYSNTLTSGMWPTNEGLENIFYEELHLKVIS